MPIKNKIAYNFMNLLGLLEVNKVINGVRHVLKGYGVTVELVDESTINKL